LNRKQWYYRNGRYFCKRRCWVTEQDKAKKEAAAKAEQAPAAQGTATEAPAAS